MTARVNPNLSGKMTKIEAAGEILNRVKKIINERRQKLIGEVFLNLAENELQTELLKAVKALKGQVVNQRQLVCRH